MVRRTTGIYRLVCAGELGGTFTYCSPEHNRSPPSSIDLESHYRCAFWVRNTLASPSLPPIRLVLSAELVINPLPSRSVPGSTQTLGNAGDVTIRHRGVAQIARADNPTHAHTTFPLHYQPISHNYSHAARGESSSAQMFWEDVCPRPGSSAIRYITSPPSSASLGHFCPIL